jgi:hypothetical protein
MQRAASFWLEREVFGADGLVEKSACHLGESAAGSGGVEAQGVVFGADGFDFGVPAEVEGEGVGNVLALREESDVRREVLADFVLQEGVVGASEDEDVDLRICFQDGADVFLDASIGLGCVLPAIFDNRHPTGAGFAGDGDVGV